MREDTQPTTDSIDFAKIVEKDPPTFKATSPKVVFFAERPLDFDIRDTTRQFTHKRATKTSARSDIQFTYRGSASAYFDLIPLPSFSLKTFLDIKKLFTLVHYCIFRSSNNTRLIVKSGS